MTDIEDIKRQKLQKRIKHNYFHFVLANILLMVVATVELGLFLNCLRSQSHLHLSNSYAGFIVGYVGVGIAILSILLITCDYAYFNYHLLDEGPTVNWFFSPHKVTIRILLTVLLFLCCDIIICSFDSSILAYSFKLNSNNLIAIESYCLIACNFVNLFLIAPYFIYSMYGRDVARYAG